MSLEKWCKSTHKKREGFPPVAVNWILNILFHIGKIPVHNIDNNKYKYGHWLPLYQWIDQVKYSSYLGISERDPGSN